MLKKEREPIGEKIKEDAFAAREYIQSLPNYTPFRICDLVKELGIELEEKDIWKFIEAFDHTLFSHPSDYANHAYVDCGMPEKEYNMDTYVCRRNMLEKITLREVKDGTTIRYVTFSGPCEFQVRDYKDYRLIGGKIYPITQKNFCSLMSLMDRWSQEQKRGSWTKEIVNQGNPGSSDKQETNQSVWILELKYGFIDLSKTHSNYAEEALGIIRSLHPDMEKIFGKGR